MADPGKPGARRRRRAASERPARKDEVGASPPAQLKTARWRIAEAGAAIAAFLLSLGVFLLGALQSLQGAEIVILPPESVYLYRDATSPENDALVLAAEIGMINTARPDFGDVATEVTLDIATLADAAFPYEGRIEPIHLALGEDRASACPIEARCIAPAGLEPLDRPRPGLLIVERRRALLSVPGGASRSDWLSFSFNDCQGAACEPFQDFQTAVARLRGAPDVRFRITLDFHSEGRKVIYCGLDDAPQPGYREAFFDFLEERGWASLRCRAE